MRRSSRRDFLATTALSLGAVPLVRLAATTQPDRGGTVFRHGVASGDPLADRVMLWTRVTTARADGADVSWSVATDPAMSRIVARGEGRTGAPRDFTVKVDVAGLSPGTTYYYRFEAERSRSPVGRTRTLPRGAMSRLRLGVASCSNYPFGYFNAYAALAARSDLDAVVHLGDYIYEYANKTFGDGDAVRPRAGARQGDGGARRLSPAACAVQSRSGLAGGAPPAPVHRRLGRS